MQRSIIHCQFSLICKQPPPSRVLILYANYVKKTISIRNAAKSCKFMEQELYDPRVVGPRLAALCDFHALTIASKIFTS